MVIPDSHFPSPCKNGSKSEGLSKVMWSIDNKIWFSNLSYQGEFTTPIGIWGGGQESENIDDYCRTRGLLFLVNIVSISGSKSGTSPRSLVYFLGETLRITLLELYAKSLKRGTKLWFWSTRGSLALILISEVGWNYSKLLFPSRKHRENVRYNMGYAHGTHCCKSRIGLCKA